MTIYSLIAFSLHKEEPITLFQKYNLKQFSFWTTSTIRQLLFFASKELANRTNQGQRQSIEHVLENESEFQGHVYVSHDKYACIVITDKSYPALVAHKLLVHVVTEIAATKSEHNEQVLPTTNSDRIIQLLSQWFEDYQVPEKADKMLSIQNELELTKQILFKTIDQLLIRGEKLNDLVAKSNDLSEQSKIFIINTRRLNRCCSII